MKLICQVGLDNYYLRKDTKGNIIQINVTDLKRLWTVEMNEEDIIKRFKALNPLVQASSEWIVTYANSCLDFNDSSASVQLINDKLSLDLVNKSSEIKVKLNLTLELQDQQQFFKEVTNPLVALITQLIEQRSKLLALVKSKDLELREYKLEGAEISRKNVETDEIIEKEFINESLSEFLDVTRNSQVRPELRLTPDLLQMFTEVTRIKDLTPNVEGHIPNNSSAVKMEKDGNPSSSVKSECKRTSQNETIIQIPRVKQRKKNFKL